MPDRGFAAAYFQLLWLCFRHPGEFSVFVSLVAFKLADIIENGKQSFFKINCMKMRVDLTEKVRKFVTFARSFETYVIR